MSARKSYAWKCRPPIAVTRDSGATFAAHVSRYPLSAAYANAVRRGKNKKVSIASQGSTTSGDETMRMTRSQM